jgi:hypothetical protein
MIVFPNIRSFDYDRFTSSSKLVLCLGHDATKLHEYDYSASYSPRWFKKTGVDEFPTHPYDGAAVTQV